MRQIGSCRSPLSRERKRALLRRHQPIEISSVPRDSCFATAPPRLAIRGRRIADNFLLTVPFRAISCHFAIHRAPAFVSLERE